MAVQPDVADGLLAVARIPQLNVKVVGQTGRMTFRKGQLFRTLVDVDVTCVARLPPMLLKESRVLLRAGELFAVMFVAPFETPGITCQPARYDALEREFVDLETRQDPKYKGYGLAIDIEVIEQHCEEVVPGRNRPS